jgi:ABC-type nitrate/sulfonate/bicarbonate transport system substrate-binding protein
MKPVSRVFVACLAVLLAASLTPVRAADGTPAPTLVKRGSMSMTPVDWAHFVAQAEGFYAREGLEVQQTLVDPPTTVTALIGGSLDVVSVDSTGFVLGVDKGAKVVAIGPVMDRNPYNLMAAPGIKTIAQLKGKKIGAASPIEIYTTVIKGILKKGGLDPEKDVEWVYGGGQGQRLAAILSGAIDAGLFTSPADEKLRERGMTSLAFTPDVVPSLALSVQSVRLDWAQQHPDIARKYLRAQANALAWLANPANKARAIEILSAATNSSPAESTAAYNYWVAKHILGDRCAVPARFDTLLSVLQSQGRLTTLKATDAAKLTDTEWCPK